ncbi:MAG: tRNA-dihydrouridine synthase, partial [gamma proteobacterium endosymbiont of Lamellibrachia anaximandri]|nr:tRNA-dihydrouridine synthase [gamma proteobacterium endosymbiont of Lamellibrachia anaximandri]
PGRPGHKQAVEGRVDFGDWDVPKSFTRSKTHLSWVKALLLEHLQTLYDFYGEHQGVRIARKHIAWYSKAHRGSAEFRKTINDSESADEQLQLIHGFFDSKTSTGSLAA